MSHIAYVNGRYVDHALAHTHIEDRGYQFADGIYDYIAFYHGALLDAQPHLARLGRSMHELSIDPGNIPALLPIIMRELIARNRRQNGAVYIQVSRATAKRDHPFPSEGRPNLVVVIRGSKMPTMQVAQQGVRVITHPDNRWGRCDIKSIALLANVLAKQTAISQGAKEAWLYKEDGMVTEGAVSNAFIIREGVIYTHPKTNTILPGITREKAIELANQLNIRVEEKAFYLRDIEQADEAFLTSTSSNVQPIIQVDEKIISDGKLGPVTQQLMGAYAQHILNETGKTW